MRENRIQRTKQRLGSFKGRGIEANLVDGRWVMDEELIKDHPNPIKYTLAIRILNGDKTILEHPQMNELLS